METIEHELKLLLSEEEYNILTQHFKKRGQRSKHINYYYDTPDQDGNKQRVTYRIREKNGVCTATVKTHRTGTVSDNTEHTVMVESPYDLSGFPHHDLIYFGFLETERFSVLFPKHIRLDLDQNKYFQFTDYEMELEFPDQTLSHKSADRVLNEIVSVLIRNGVAISLFSLLCRIVNSPTKSERFFARWEYGNRENSV